MASLKERITEDMKHAMRARDQARLSSIRLLLAAIKQKEVDDRAVPADGDVLGIVEKMLKQRRESIAQFDAAGRDDLAAIERFEMQVLSDYLPQQMGEAEVGDAVTAAVSEAGATGVRDMGRVMALLKSRLTGRADMAKVSALVKTRLER